MPRNGKSSSEDDDPKPELSDDVTWKKVIIAGVDRDDGEEWLLKAVHNAQNAKNN